MKHLGKILTLLILVVVFLLLDRVTGFMGIFSSPPEIRIERTTMDLGRDVMGDKISIRDNIKVSQTGQYKVDGNLLGLGNERKTMTISFLTELGYFIDDVISSERIDSMLGDDLVSRSLVLEMPFPDTLSFIEMRQDEKSNEWFWEGWYKDHKNYTARQKFLSEMRENAYRQFESQQIDPKRTTVLVSATKTMLNYVNNGYKLGNEEGFSNILVRFRGKNGEVVVVRCNDKGCSQEVEEEPAEMG